MKNKRIGQQTVVLSSPPAILGYGSTAGKKEGEGPLAGFFDFVGREDSLGKDSWEKAETAFQQKALSYALEKADLSPGDLDCLFSGDLLNQCIASSYAMRETPVPYFGLYGACSTMAEGLALAALLLDGGFGRNIGAMASSHFCSAERQYRSPLEYGGQKPPTAQWTATGAGAVILGNEGTGHPRITHVTVGRVIDKGLTDANNMGAAMAPAACHTIRTHFADTGRTPGDYDLIVTGDLGILGQEIVTELLGREGFDLTKNYRDCGAMLFDAKAQDAHAGASGCGCSALVLTGYLLRELEAGHLHSLLFCGTGALHSPTSVLQGESIPGICHAVAVEGRSL